MLNRQVTWEVGQWWDSLSVAAKVVVAATAVSVVVALSAWIYAAYSIPSLASRPDSGPNEVAPISSSLRHLLSLPLPGTRQRSQLEAADNLSRALEAFDNIATANVVFAQPYSQSPPSAAPPRLSVQLHFSSSTTPTTEWIQNIVTFLLHSVPDLQLENLLIADGSGRLLFAHGQVNPPLTPQPIASSEAIPAPATMSGPSLSWPLLISLSAAALLVILLYVLLSRQRRARQSAPVSDIILPTESAGPSPSSLPFLAQLSAPQIIALLGDERPEVADLVTHYLPEDNIIDQVRRTLNLSPTGPAPSQRTVREDVLTSVSAALQAKLSALDSVDESPAPVAQTTSGGDNDE